MTVLTTYSLWRETTRSREKTVALPQTLCIQMESWGCPHCSPLQRIPGPRICAHTFYRWSKYRSQECPPWFRSRREWLWSGPAGGNPSLCRVVCVWEGGRVMGEIVCIEWRCGIWRWLSKVGYHHNNVHVHSGLSGSCSITYSPTQYNDLYTCMYRNYMLCSFFSHSLTCSSVLPPSPLILHTHTHTHTHTHSPFSNTSHTLPFSLPYYPCPFTQTHTHSPLTVDMWTVVAWEVEGA